MTSPQRAKEWRLKNASRVKAMARAAHLLNSFGLTVGEYDRMYVSQGGLCKICGKPESTKRNGVVKRLAVDHSKKTGKIRSLLCAKCNTAMGGIGESVASLKMVIDYLVAHGEQ